MSGAPWPAIAAVSLVALLGAVLLRLRLLLRRPGYVECALRSEGGGWSEGILHFGAASLDWYRAFSLAPHPARSWPRAQLVILGRRPHPSRGRRTSVTELAFSSATAETVLALAELSAVAMVSWLESVPPGSLGAGPDAKAPQR